MAEYPSLWKLILGEMILRRRILGYIQTNTHGDHLDPSVEFENCIVVGIYDTPSGVLT